MLSSTFTRGYSDLSVGKAGTGTEFSVTIYIYGSAEFATRKKSIFDGSENRYQSRFFPKQKTEYEAPPAGAFLSPPTRFARSRKLRARPVVWGGQPTGKHKPTKTGDLASLRCGRKCAHNREPDSDAREIDRNCWKILRLRMIAGERGGRPKIVATIWSISDRPEVK